MGETLLSVRRTRQADAVVVRALGEADLLTATLLSDALTAGYTDAGPEGTLIADLTGVTFLGSAGLAELLRCKRRCEEQGTAMRVVVTAELRRVLDIAGLVDVLDVTESEGDSPGGAPA